MQPLCFVLMPFGIKKDPAGGPDIDFDKIYQQAIEPAIRAADLVPIRADEEKTGGIIHKPMFERLLLCDYALADLTTANANVFYELGVRHTARPQTTFTIFAKHQPIPFDINYLRSMHYELGCNNALTQELADGFNQQLTEKLKSLRDNNNKHAPVDSPIFQLLSDWKPAEIAHLKTDVFAERVEADEDLKRKLAQIRSDAKSQRDNQAACDALAALRQQLGSIDALEAGTCVDLMLTYRALADWQGMIDCYHQMPETLKRQTLVKEQLGFAYNRRAGATQSPSDRDTALAILEDVVVHQGPSSETMGLIGRIYKDQWQDALNANKTFAASGFLNKAIDAYKRGFMADPRDAYPGINMLTLMDIQGGEENTQEKQRLLPVVLFAVEQRLVSKEPDYWDYATKLELAVLGHNQIEMANQLANALASFKEKWQLTTTADNLGMICQARENQQQETEDLEQLISELRQASA